MTEAKEAFDLSIALLQNSILCLVNAWFGWVCIVSYTCRVILVPHLCVIQSRVFGPCKILHTNVLAFTHVVNQFFLSFSKGNLVCWKQPWINPAAPWESGTVLMELDYSTLLKQSVIKLVL